MVDVSTSFKANQTIRGTSGRLWINETLMLNVKKFEVKIKAVYEDVDSCNPGKDRVITGYEVSGSITLNKVDSYFASLLADEWKKLSSPDVTLIGKIDGADSNGYERIKVTSVTFDELKFGFDSKKLCEEDMGFEASDYEYIDKIA